MLLHGTTGCSLDGRTGFMLSDMHDNLHLGSMQVIMHVSRMQFW